MCVLLAVYNGEPHLREQLDTLLNQSGVVLDIFVSLDLSTDNSLALLDMYQRDNSNLHLLPTGIKFGSAGRNFCHLLKVVNFSKYDLVCFADQDDYWPSNKLSNAALSLESHRCDGYSSNVTAFWSNGAEKEILKHQPLVKFDYLFESAGPGCTFVLTKALAIAIQEYLLQIGDRAEQIWLHDWFCYAFARSRNYKWFIDSQSQMRYRQHESNSVGANANWETKLKRVREVLDGTALSKVVIQAGILHLYKLSPIQLMEKKSSLSFLKLAFMARQCRRKKSDQLFFFIAMLLLAVKRLFR